MALTKEDIGKIDTTTWQEVVEPNIPTIEPPIPVVDSAPIPPTTSTTPLPTTTTKPVIAEEDKINTTTWAPDWYKEQYPNIVEGWVRIPGITEKGKDKTSLDTISDFGWITKEAFIRWNEVWKTNQEIVDWIRSRLAKDWYDMTDFDKRIWQYQKDFGDINLSTNDFYKWLQNWETYWKFYEQNSPDYQSAKKLFDWYNSLDKSEAWIKRAVNDWTLVWGLLDKVNQDPLLASYVKIANREKIDKEIDEIIATWSVADIFSLTNAWTAEYVKSVFEKFWLNKSYEDQMSSNKELKNYQNQYLSSTKSITDLNAQKQTLLDKIKAENPWAPLWTIYRIYKKENLALEEQINSAKWDAEFYKAWYDLELNNTINWINYNTAQADKKFNEYKDIFNKQYWEYSAESAQTRQIEMQKLNDWNVTSWVYDKNGALTWLNKEGRIITTLEWYKNTDPTQTEWLVAKWVYWKEWELIWLDKKGKEVSRHTWVTEDLNEPETTFKEIWSKIYDDWSSTVIYYDEKTKQIVNKQFWPKWEDLVINWWADDLLGWKTATYGWVYDNFTWLDIALPYKSDFTSPVNWTVLEYKPNNWDYGNSLIIEDNWWNIIQFNHLYWTKLEAWSPVWAWTILWQVGNSWNVKKSDWTTPSTSELAAWRGSHLDIVTWEAWTTNRNIQNARSSKETEQFLNWFNSKKKASSWWLSTEQNIMVGWLTKELFWANASDNDRELVQNIVKGFPEGTPRNTIALVVKDFQFDDEAQTENAMNLLNKVRTKFPIADIDLAWLANFVRDWNYDWAIRSIESKLLSTIPEDNLIRENKVKYTIDRVNELQKLIKQWEWIEWPISWTLEEWLKKFKSTEAAAIKQKITYLVADMRNRLSWTAVTADESAFLEPIIPDLSDKAGIILNKISDLGRVPVEQLNALRNELWLPALKSNQIWKVNVSDRLDLYKWTTPILNTPIKTTPVDKSRIQEGLDLLRK